MGMIGQKILIVEDDDSLRPALERLLNAAGWRTVTYTSAEALLADAAAGDAACVVCDLKLPAMSGFDLLTAWREQGGRPLVILITAYDAPGLSEEAARRGAARRPIWSNRFAAPHCWRPSTPRSNPRDWDKRPPPIPRHSSAPSSPTLTPAPQSGHGILIPLLNRRISLMLLNKRTLPKLPLVSGLKTACSILALTACLAIGSVQAADQGPRHHARGQYDTGAAIYVVVDGDELIAIGERFQVSADTLKAQNKLTSDEIKPGQKLTIGSSASATGGKPNILFIVGDDVGVGDLGPYGGGEGRGMPTPSIDKMAADGMTFFSFYAQPSCTPGRAAMQTGRIPNRSGMTTVAFQGQGGGLPKAEWTLASVLKQGGYQTYFTGKWHLGEADYALPNAQGYDEMKYVGLYHLNAYTYGDPTWYPDMDPELRDMFNKVTIGSLSGKAGEKAKEDFKINGQYVNEPGKPVTLHGVTYSDGVVGIPFFDGYVEKAALEFLDKAAKEPSKPFFLNVNFMKVHQPNLPAPEFEHKSMSKTKYADSMVEFDTRVGHIMDKLRELGLDQNTLVFFTTDNGAWQDVYPDAGYTPFRGTKGTVREGGNRVPAIAVWPGKIKADAKNHDIVGGLDLMATFASVAGVKLPEKDREGQPIIFDSYDITPVLFGTGKDPRTAWFYFTENELTPGAARVGHYKAVFNLRGDDGQATGGLAVDSNLGWKGSEKYVAIVPQVFDLWQDPQERYDIFMNNYTEHTWTLVTISQAIKDLMKTYVQYPPRKMQSEGYTGPITLSNYQRFQWVREQLSKEGVSLPMPTGN